MHRFFVPKTLLKDQLVSLMGDVAYQIRTVLRMRVGRKIILLDNEGYEYFVEITHIAKNVVVGQVERRYPSEGEPMFRLSLYQSMLKWQKFEWVLQKGTELGITEFIPVISERSILSEIDVVDKKRERWEKIIQEAAEQCQRGKIPQLLPAMMFNNACQRARDKSDLAWVAWENAQDYSLSQVLENVAEVPESASLFIGPEGGFTPDEIRFATAHDIPPIWLGKRILRAETAGLVVASILFYECGEME